MMFGWFRRSSAKPSFKLPQQPPPAARDWEVGDVAKCLVGPSGTWFGKSGAQAEGPKGGELFRVIGVFVDDTVYLRFARWPSNGYAAGNFKKLRACTADFREQLRRPTKLPKIRTLPEPVR